MPRLQVKTLIVKKILLCWLIRILRCGNTCVESGGHTQRKILLLPRTSKKQARKEMEQSPQVEVEKEDSEFLTV
jgi:hypothetical protein